MLFNYFFIIMNKNQLLALIQSTFAETGDQSLSNILKDFDIWMGEEVFDQVQDFSECQSDLLSYLMNEHNIFIRSSGWEFYVRPKAKSEE